MSGAGRQAACLGAVGAMIDLLSDYLPVVMFVALLVLLFSGLPVAYVLGGVGLIAGWIGIELGVLRAAQLLSIMPRIWGGIAADVVLVAVPLFILMGSILRKAASPRTCWSV